MTSVQTRSMASQAILASKNIEIEKDHGVSTPIDSTKLSSSVNPSYYMFHDLSRISPVAMMQHESFNICQSQSWKEKSFNTDSSSESSSSDTLPIFSCKPSCITVNQSPTGSAVNFDFSTSEELNFNGGNVISLCQSLQGMSFHVNSLPETNKSPSLTSVFTPTLGQSQTMRTSEYHANTPQLEGGHSHFSTASQTDMCLNSPTYDRLFALIETNIKEIFNLRNTYSQINERFDKLEEKLGSEIHSNCSLISSLTDKWETDLRLVNEQVDSSFGYVDNRMDLIFLAKAKEIDEHFEELLEHVDTQVKKCTDAKTLELEKRMKNQSSDASPNTVLTALKKDLELKLRTFKEELLPLCCSTVNDYLERKEVDIDFEAIASECIDKKIHDAIRPMAHKNGVLAFQSPHSPLSNLFVAPIKNNGIVYPSAEHAFQHEKAIFCNDLALAQAILRDPCPFEAMATGKRVATNKEWQSIQLTVMEKILRLKLEQVPAFVNELKASENHYLVENTRSPYWGSGTPFNSPSIFCRQFPGQNRLGKLLVHIRDNF